MIVNVARSDVYIPGFPIQDNIEPLSLTVEEFVIAARNGAGCCTRNDDI
jgi:hypothetical protein